MPRAIYLTPISVKFQAVPFRVDPQCCFRPFHC